MAYESYPALIKKIERVRGGPLRPRTRIHRVGIELEGGWNKVPARSQVVHDGSVFNRGQSVPKLPAGSPPILAIGEVNSLPLTEKAVGAYIKTHYPQALDATCGLHVHMSFLTPAIYERLVVEAYGSIMIDGLLGWAMKKKFPPSHPIWSRLRGENRFCTHDFIAEEQIKSKNKSKHYTAINYCWSLHQTVEVRVLPMFENVDDAIEAVSEVIAITNAFLVATAKRPEKLTQTLEIDPASISPINEEYRQCV